MIDDPVHPAPTQTDNSSFPPISEPSTVDLPAVDEQPLYTHPSANAAAYDTNFDFGMNIVSDFHQPAPASELQDLFTEAELVDLFNSDPSLFLSSPASDPLQEFMDSFVPPPGPPWSLISDDFSFSGPSVPLHDEGDSVLRLPPQPPSPPMSPGPSVEDPTAIAEVHAPRSRRLEVDTRDILPPTSKRVRAPTALKRQIDEQEKEQAQKKRKVNFNVTIHPLAR